MNYSEGDWVRFKHRGIVHKAQKVLEVRPDDMLVVGSHDNDPQTMAVDPEDVTETL